MKIFDARYLNDLTDQAKGSLRLRQHRNIHQSYQDACQRLFNAIEPGSYIRPHRHAADPKDELLIAVRGAMALLTFDDQGVVTDILRFGEGGLDREMAAGAEVPASTWHTVLALEPGCILLEVKAGPFDPNQPKDLALWAPEEGSAEAWEYLNRLVELVGARAATSIAADASGGKGPADCTTSICFENRIDTRSSDCSGLTIDLAID